jgi:hypothetical protein
MRSPMTSRSNCAKRQQKVEGQTSAAITSPPPSSEPPERRHSVGGNQQRYRSGMIISARRLAMRIFLTTASQVNDASRLYQNRPMALHRLGTGMTFLLSCGTCANRPRLWGPSNLPKFARLVALAILCMMKGFLRSLCRSMRTSRSLSRPIRAGFHRDRLVTPIHYSIEWPMRPTARLTSLHSICAGRRQRKAHRRQRIPLHPLYRRHRHERSSAFPRPRPSAMQPMP